MSLPGSPITPGPPAQKQKLQLLERRRSLPVNEEYTAQSTAIQEAQAGRELNVSLGRTQAEEASGRARFIADTLQGLEARPLEAK